MRSLALAKSLVPKCFFSIGRPYDSGRSAPTAVNTRLIKAIPVAIFFCVIRIILPRFVLVCLFFVPPFSGKVRHAISGNLELAHAMPIDFKSINVLGSQDAAIQVGTPITEQ